MLLTILAIILLFGWVAGLVFRVAGGFIHIVLVIAIVLFILGFVMGRA